MSQSVGYVFALGALACGVYVFYVLYNFGSRDKRYVLTQIGLISYLH